MVRGISHSCPVISRIAGLRSDPASRSCAYGAVGEVIGCTPLEVQDHLQDWNTRRGLAAPHRDPQTSWVVNAGTGEPTGYTDPQSKHPDLHRDRVILRTGSELLALLKRCANP